MKALKHYWFWFKRDIVRILFRCKSLCLFLSKHFLKQYLALFYFNWTGNKLDYNHITNLHEALFKTSLKNSKSEKKYLIAQCADKYAVRKYVTDKGYGDTLNELYGVYSNVNDIDFDKLPNQFVMKMNNASGRNYICIDKTKMNVEEVKNKFSVWLQDKNFGLLSGEWQYSLMPPKIIVEKYLENLGQSSLIDYKFYCIGGKVDSCMVAYGRSLEDAHAIGTSFDHYDINWNRTEYIRPDQYTIRKYIDKPKSYSRMIKMAEDLCAGFEFVRFDLYEIEGKIIFGEMTFTPNGCVGDSMIEDFYVKVYEDNKYVFD